MFKSDLDRYAGYTVEQHKSLTQDLFFFRHDSFSSQHWTATRKVKNLDNPTLTSSAQPHTVYMFTIYNVTIVLVALYRALKCDRRQAVLCIYECNHIKKKSSVESINRVADQKSTNIIECIKNLKFFFLNSHEHSSSLFIHSFTLSSVHSLFP